jgi:hypothetical protein
MQLSGLLVVGGVGDVGGLRRRRHGVERDDVQARPLARARAVLTASPLVVIRMPLSPREIALSMALI